MLRLREKKLVDDLSAAAVVMFFVERGKIGDAFGEFGIDAVPKVIVGMFNVFC